MRIGPSIPVLKSTVGQPGRHGWALLAAAAIALAGCGTQPVPSGPTDYDPGLKLLRERAENVCLVVRVLETRYVDSSPTGGGGDPAAAPAAYYGELLAMDWWAAIFSAKVAYAVGAEAPALPPTEANRADILNLTPGQRVVLLDTAVSDLRQQFDAEANSVSGGLLARPELLGILDHLQEAVRTIRSL